MLENDEVAGSRDRGPGISWDELAAADSRSMPAILKRDTYSYLGSEPLSTERYTSREFFQRELDRMWPPVGRVFRMDLAPPLGLGEPRFSKWSPEDGLHGVDLES